MATYVRSFFTSAATVPLPFSRLTSFRVCAGTALTLARFSGLIFTKWHFFLAARNATENGTFEAASSFQQNQQFSRKKKKFMLNVPKSFNK
jgi:hypothetical protein